jgi:hypothetical protein
VGKINFKKTGRAVNAACHRYMSPGLRGALRESGHCQLQEEGTQNKKEKRKEREKKGKSI